MRRCKWCNTPIDDGEFCSPRHEEQYKTFMFKKWYLLLSTIILIILSGCAEIASASGETLSTMRPIATQSLTTPFYTATPTVGWESTAQAAQAAEINALATADIARAEVESAHIAAAMITAQSEANILAVAQITQEAFAISAAGTQYVYDGTATAAMTAIPLTATAQSANSTAIASYATQQSSAMTATFEAPAIMRDAKSAEAFNAVADFWVRVWALAMLGVFALATPIVLYVATRRNKPTTAATIAPVGFQPITQVPESPPVVIAMTTNHGGGFSKTERTVLPCTREQFTKLTVGVLNDGQSLAFEYWTRKESEVLPAPFTRDEFTAVRNWLLSNRLAQSAGNGAIILTSDGEGMFIEWINSQVLPEAYSFEKPKVEEPV